MIDCKFDPKPHMQPYDKRCISKGYLRSTKNANAVYRTLAALSGAVLCGVILLIIAL